MRAASIGLVAVAAGLIILIAAGLFDPKPFGPLVRIDQPVPLSLSGRGERTFPQSAPWTTGAQPDRFSIRLTATHAAGEMDSGYGLALGDGARRLVVAVSPLGYVAVWEGGDGEIGRLGDWEISHVPWQTWPHARQGGDANEIWLDVARVDGRAAITAWINRELLWQGEVDQSASEVGLWLGSFGGSTTVDYRTLEWFAGPGG